MQLKYIKDAFQFSNLVLPSNFREFFRKPFGVIFRGRGEEVAENLLRFVKSSNPLKFVCVGDMVFSWMLNLNFVPDVVVVDFKISRRSVGFEFDKDVFDGFFRVSNPAGFITCNAWMTIQYVLSLQGKYLIEVDGEEDLLALPAVLCAPIGSIVSFGVPGEGVMAVPVNLISRREAFRLLSLLRPSELD